MNGDWLREIGEPADWNFGRFDSPEATAALAAFANATSDEETQQPLWPRAQRIFVDQVPIMPLASRPFIN